jgi:RimJ/RimL family protein N-acetyltransferase
LNIREALPSDWDSIWLLFKEVVKPGDTYGFSSETTKEQGKQLWLDTPRKTFMVEDSGRAIGTYYIKSNNEGPGGHVANCGYMVASIARGQGLATLMCEHSQKIAIELGYQAMQFNYVSSSNRVALRLWQKLGFSEVGRLPKAFNHPKLGLVDAFVMYKWL